MLQLVLYWIHFILVVITVISVLKARKSPASSIAWLFAIIVVPVLGMAAYLLAGVDRKTRRLIPQIPEEIFSEHLKSSLEKQDHLIEILGRSPDPVSRRSARSIRLLTRAASAPVTAGNTVRTFYDGREKFAALLEDITGARESINMEYYIWRSDDLGEKIFDALAARAADGVTVRLIFDGWGSFGKISFAYRRRMKAAGIEYAYFLDLANPVARFKLNYRNHRKIAVIDGRIAYTGGMNVGTEYIDGGRRFESWRDTHIRVTGPAVSMLQAVFLVDWYNSGKQLLLVDSMFPEPEIVTGNIPGTPMQIAISGPDSRWEGIRLHYLELLNGAREEVFIQTPYYIPGEAVEQAMVAAALRGVRVVLMTVGPPDKRVPYWAAQTYFHPLLNAGVEIYRYQAGFLHSKVMVQDRVVASVGTCNVDLRSFHLDYEVNAVIYSPEEAESLAQRILDDIQLCSRITQDDLSGMPAWAQFRNNIFRLLSPLM